MIERGKKMEVARRRKCKNKEEEGSEVDKEETEKKKM